jgi:hypothetical protein
MRVNLQNWDAPSREGLFAAFSFTAIALNPGIANEQEAS